MAVKKLIFLYNLGSFLLLLNALKTGRDGCWFGFRNSWHLWNGFCVTMGGGQKSEKQWHNMRKLPYRKFNRAFCIQQFHDLNDLNLYRAYPGSAVEFIDASSSSSSSKLIYTSNLIKSWYQQTLLLSITKIIVLWCKFAE